MKTIKPLLLIIALCFTLSLTVNCQKKRVENPPPPKSKDDKDKPSPGDSVEKIKIGDMVRTFIRHIPTGYDGTTPVPLVIVLHGKGGNGQSMEKLTGFSAKADENNFVVVYPNGVGNPTIWNNTMNTASNNGADDVAFLTDMIDRLQKNLHIDEKRIYLCGFSSGAVMTYFMAGKLSERFAAVGVSAGSVGIQESASQVVEDPKPTNPVAVIHFHGRKDTTFPYDGGKGGDGGGGGDYPQHLSVATTINFWTQADGCSNKRERTPSQDNNITIDNYQGCRNNTEVILYTFANGIHEWPTLKNNDKFDATDRMWEFFKNHPRS